MILQEALKLENQIRRRCWKNDKYLYAGKNFLTDITIEDFYADDWEPKEDKITISKNDFYKALSETLKEVYPKTSFYYHTQHGVEKDPTGVAQSMCAFSDWGVLVKKLFGEKK